MPSGVRANPLWPAWLTGRAELYVHRVTDAVADDARANQHGSIKATVHAVHLPLRGEVVVGTDHWAFIEYGTPPHLITPARKRALWWAGAAHPVRKVRHPGTRAYAPMRRALYQRRELGGRR